MEKAGNFQNINGLITHIFVFYFSDMIRRKESEVHTKSIRIEDT